MIDCPDDDFQKLDDIRIWKALQTWIALSKICTSDNICESHNLISDVSFELQRSSFTKTLNLEFLNKMFLF